MQASYVTVHINRDLHVAIELIRSIFRIEYSNDIIKSNLKSVSDIYDKNSPYNLLFPVAIYLYMEVKLKMKYFKNMEYL